MSTSALSDTDFAACEKFFSQPLPALIRQACVALDGLELTEASSYKLERLTLLLDLIGTECVKDTLRAPSDPRPDGS